MTELPGKCWDCHWCKQIDGQSASVYYGEPAEAELYECLLTRIRRLIHELPETCRQYTRSYADERIAVDA